MTKKFLQKTRIKNEPLTRQIIAKFGLSRETTEILLSRGISDIDTAERFLCPDFSHLHDPFLFKDMSAVVERLKQAADLGETVVVYGDYDADGLTSCALLSLCLAEIGVNVAPFIPERKNGYGLQKVNLVYLAEEVCPDLVITTDCGISCVDEVEFLQNELGIDVIVTDHHEPPEVLPDCLIINPKSDAGYPFRELCGAGVAFKIVSALMGDDESKKYIDIAALGTLADCVPLVDENRVIAKFGIKEINKNKRVGIKALCTALKLTGELSAHDIIMKLIPKLNAPGRIDEAKSVLDFFLSQDVVALKALSEKILQDNTARQVVTEEILHDIYAQMYKECSFHNRLLAFQGNWKDGIAGIVAARLKETFYRPSILFVDMGDGMLKGSGRSVEGLDMHKMLASMSDILEGFGGHAMACGASLRQENFEIFKVRAEEYLSKLPEDLFIEKHEYDFCFDQVDPNKILKDLDFFEPCLPEERPVFFAEGRYFEAKQFKSMSPHINIGLGDFIIKAFYNYIDLLPALNNENISKQLLFNVGLDSFSKKPTGLLKDLKVLSDYDDEDPLVCKLFEGGEVNDLHGITADRDVFSLYYRHIKNSAKSASNYENFYNACFRDGLSFRQFTACLIVFSELELFSINLMPFFVRANSIKTDLTKSEFYQKIANYLQN